MRKPGLEPGRVSPLDPKSSASTNSATSAGSYMRLTSATQTLTLLMGRFWARSFEKAAQMFPSRRDVERPTQGPRSNRTRSRLRID
jgi:hypothetical protein